MNNNIFFRNITLDKDTDDVGVCHDDWPDHHGPDLQPHVRRLHHPHQVTLIHSIAVMIYPHQPIKLSQLLSQLIFSYYKHLTKTY